MGKFINPFTDWGFKRIFGQKINKDLLIAFLNSLFEGEFVIKDIEFKDKEMLGLTKDSRGAVFDVYCTTDDGKNIIVEMQNSGQTYFIDRSIFYTSHAIVNQSIRGNWNYKLSPVYTICFMNFLNKDDGINKFRTDVGICDMKTGALLSGNVRIVYLALPLFKREEADECKDDFERWIYILKNMSTFERMPFLAKNAVFQKLAAITDVRTLSKQEMEKYDEDLKNLRDAYATYEYAENKGLAKGLEKGLEKGREEGMDEANRKTVRNLTAMGMSPDIIAKATGLSKDKIREMQQSAE